jgi:hypothetical protein
MDKPSLAVGCPLLGLLLAMSLPACAPALSTFQPAHVAPPGHVLAGGGVEVAVPTGAILTGIDTAKDLGRRAQAGEMLTDAEKLQILDAGVNLVVNSPSFGPHLGVACTIIDRVEANVRFAGNAFRLGGRYQILKRATGPFDMTVGLGVSRFSYQFPISDEIPVLRLNDFSRWQIDLPLLIGTSRDYLRVWVGPKLLVTWFETQLTLTIPNDTAAVARFDGRVTYLGGQGGLALGYRHAFVALELTIAESFGSARASVSTFTTPSHDINISTLIVYPSIGIMIEI